MGMIEWRFLIFYRSSPLPLLPASRSPSQSAHSLPRHCEGREVGSIHLSIPPAPSLKAMFSSPTSTPPQFLVDCKVGPRLCSRSK